MPLKSLNSTAKVSVIVPVFNEERAISNALDSILMQDTTFPVEIIVVDDGSTDGTAEIVARYAAAYPQIRPFKNARCLGKGASFKLAYEEARGDYFHVLDGDDFFVNRHKLQRQVEFLDSNREYFAVGHNTLVRRPDGFSMVSGDVVERDWSNEECLAGQVYSHTSAILYRKLQPSLPDFFVDEEFRGDSAVFFFHAFLSKQKFRFLPGIWSVYSFHGAGIWSRLSAEKQRALNLRIIEAFRTKVVDLPGSRIDRILEERAERAALAAGTFDGVEPTTLEGVMKFAEQASSKVFAYREEAFKSMHAFSRVDEVCEAAGRVIFLEQGGRTLAEDFRENHAVLLVSGLVPNGGGVFREIKELVEALGTRGYSVTIISTQKIATNDDIFAEHFSAPNVNYWQADGDESFGGRLEKVIARIRAERPALLYPFVTHNDPIGCAAIQAGGARQVVFDFVYDHGLSLGVINSSIDTIIVKTISQARALRAMIPCTNMSLVPPFMRDRSRPAFRPLRNGTLTTASAAARSYKVETGYRYSYADIVVQILACTDGCHIHYGPLSEATQQQIRERLAKLGKKPGQFRHIPWADDFSGSLLDEGVDLFVSPFPICSARISMEVMACGIPSLNHNVESPRIPQSIDFIDPQQFTWENPKELTAVLDRASEDVLLEKSASARSYFLANNLSTTAIERLFTLPPLVLSPQARPEFVISEFSESFVVEVETTLFGANRIRFPISTVADSQKSRFWLRSHARRRIRKKFHEKRRKILNYVRLRGHPA